MSSVPIGTTLSETGALGEGLAAAVATRGVVTSARAARRPTVIDRMLNIGMAPFR
jgi:hypothetical protein